MIYSSSCKITFVVFVVLFLQPHEGQAMVGRAQAKESRREEGEGVTKEEEKYSSLGLAGGGGVLRSDCRAGRLRGTSSTSPVGTHAPAPA
jgi:hypothetical protein